MEEYKHENFMQASSNSNTLGGINALVAGNSSLSSNGTNNKSNTQSQSPSKSKKKKKTSNLTPSLSSLRASLLPPPRQQCQQCNRNYGNRRDLRRHILAHHQGIRYMCRLCGKVMMSSKSVRAHLKSSAHRLSNLDEIALNIEKITPNEATNGSDSGGSNGSGGATTGNGSAAGKKQM